MGRPRGQGGREGESRDVLACFRHVERAGLVSGNQLCSTVLGYRSRAVRWSCALLFLVGCVSGSGVHSVYV